MSASPHAAHHLGAPAVDEAMVARTEIGNMVVRCLRELTGRSPGDAMTLMGPDVAVVTLRDCLTTAEKTLIEEGHRDLVVKVRAALHEELRRRARGAVEQLTGREVVSCLADQQYDPDLAIIAFAFAPTPIGERRTT